MYKEIYYRELANVIIEAENPKICSWQAGGLDLDWNFYFQLSLWLLSPPVQVQRQEKSNA